VQGQLKRHDVGWDLLQWELSFVSGRGFGLQTDARVLWIVDYPIH
jgi:hypothetical protein